MKTLTNLAFLATLAVFLFSPLSLELSGSLLFSAGLLTILTADYSKPRLPVLALGVPATSSKRSFFRLAA